MGLNAGLDQAREVAMADGIERLVVLHGDLPNLAVDDVRRSPTRPPVCPRWPSRPTGWEPAPTGWR